MYFEKIPSGVERRKIALCEAQNWRCCYCRLPVVFYFGQSTEQNAATFEHVTPKSKGGTDDYFNLVIACWLCNQVRDRASATNFADSVAKLLENSAIKAAWHKFTPIQMYLLRQEIEFAALQMEYYRGKNNPGFLKIYQRKLAERKKRLEVH